MKKHFRKLMPFIFVLTTWFGTKIYAETAYTIDGKKVSFKEVVKKHKSEFYKLNKEKYEIINQEARGAYLEHYWKVLAKRKNSTVEKVKAATIKIPSAKELDSTLKRFEKNPQLAKLPKLEQRKQVKAYLMGMNARQMEQDILNKAIKNKKLKILFKEPRPPAIKITKDDHVRYRAKGDYERPVKGGCKGEDCEITIVEYSEYECPYCKRILPTTEKVFNTYKGKVRWIVRDFPLGFHKRAVPAAVAAKCAAKQGKYWDMYYKLFEDQRKLEDKDFKKYAKDLKLNQNKFASCLKNPKKIKALIEKNQKEGATYGVSGTPGFFINGRPLSGAQPYPAFRQIIEEELARKPKSLAKKSVSKKKT